MAWIDHCRMHAHCRTCRTSPEWRRKAGAPDTCPDGFTAETAPQPQEKKEARETRLRRSFRVMCVHSRKVLEWQRCCGGKRRPLRLVCDHADVVALVGMTVPAAGCLKCRFFVAVSDATTEIEPTVGS